MMIETPRWFWPVWIALGLLTVLLAVLNIADVIAIPWWLVLLPALLPPLAAVSLFALLVLAWIAGGSH
ncbi:hypothetical protein [Terrihabitans sp. B22-R8]|uniref:hypothetical protein n=1 Tax=Terrihabitans sp. B22-R8 TaxID=3425128 RepID=UPI00403C4108